MKAFASVVALSIAGAALAQRGEGVPRLEGDYESFQWGRSVHRTLHLDRDGGVEIVTEVDGAPDDRNEGVRPRDDRDNYARYGWTAGEAARGHAVHQSGSWTQRDGRVQLRLDAVRDRSGFRTRGREDADLQWTGSGLVFSHADAMYGRDDIEFRPVRGRTDGGDPLPTPLRRVEYDGSVRDGDGFLALDGIDFMETGGKGTLVVRAGKERIELRGDVENREGQTIFRPEGDDIDRLFSRSGGTLTIVVEAGQVRSVRGTARLGDRRIEFVDREKRPTDGGNFITPLR